MKIKAILCLIAGVFLLANIAKVQTLPYGFEPWVSDSTVWVTPQDNSIANAVAEVPIGGTIFLWPGIYNEDGVVINKRLTIRGFSKEEMNQKWISDSLLFQIAADSVIIENLWIEATTDGRVFLPGAYQSFWNNCTIKCSTCVMSTDTVSWTDMQLYPLQHLGFRTTSGQLNMHGDIIFGEHFATPAEKYYGFRVNGVSVDPMVYCDGSLYMYCDSTAIICDGTTGGQFQSYGYARIKVITRGTVEINANALHMDGDGSAIFLHGEIINACSTKATILFEDTGHGRFENMLIKNTTRGDSGIAICDTASSQSISVLDCRFFGWPVLSTGDSLRIFYYGKDSFTTTATEDTVLVYGIPSNAVIVATPLGNTYEAKDFIQAYSRTDTLIFKRAAAGTSNRSYGYIAIAENGQW